jgi:hypothetical protein
MYTFTSKDGPNLDELRARLRKMTDPELLRYGQASKYMCSPDAGKSLVAERAAGRRFISVR